MAMRGGPVIQASLSATQSFCSPSGVQRPRLEGRQRSPSRLGTCRGILVKCSRLASCAQRWSRQKCHPPRLLVASPVPLGRCPLGSTHIYFHEIDLNGDKDCLGCSRCGSIDHLGGSRCSRRKDSSSLPAQCHHKSKYSSSFVTCNCLGEHEVCWSAAPRMQIGGGGGREGGGEEEEGGGRRGRNLGQQKLSALQADASRSAVRTHATSTVVALVAVTGLVAAAAAALRKESSLMDSELQEQQASLPKCESCEGSGLCIVCNGEGFVMKTLSKEEMERGRRNSSSAATRFTAGLANKWKYCPSCSGGRSCPACQGKGYI